MTEDLTARALLDAALQVRDLKTSIRVAIEAIERKSYESARQELKQALDEEPIEAKAKRKAAD